jgi:hypothetical protein
MTTENFKFLLKATAQKYTITDSKVLFDEYGLDFGDEEENGACLAVSTDDTCDYVRVAYPDGKMVFYVQESGMEGDTNWCNFEFAVPHVQSGVE